jgi:hypothetical protein
MWDLSNDGVEVFVPASNDALRSSFPITAHSDSAGNESVFLMTRQHPTAPPPSPTPCSGTGVLDNAIRIKRSVNQGAWGNEQAINVDGTDGFVYTRDWPMLNDHITCDPNTSSKAVYAFYVRNEATSYGAGGGKRNILYCKASVDGGNSWGGERMVFTLDVSHLPPYGFADVPNCANQSSPGFYRIGRVWSCVDPNGNIYVAWMDNRYGVYSYNGDTSKDYWHVFCSKSTSTSQGDTWSTPIQVSGTSGDLSTASIGGFRGNHVPPGDVLTCDADSQYLYVAWPDSRNQQGGHTTLPIQAYFRTVQF